MFPSSAIHLKKEVSINFLKTLNPRPPNAPAVRFLVFDILNLTFDKPMRRLILENDFGDKIPLFYIVTL